MKQMYELNQRTAVEERDLNELVAVTLKLECELNMAIYQMK